MATKDYPAHDHEYSTVVEQLPNKDDPRGDPTKLSWSQCRVCGKSDPANPKPAEATKVFEKLTGEPKRQALILAAKTKLAALENAGVSDATG